MPPAAESLCQMYLQCANKYGIKCVASEEGVRWRYEQQTPFTTFQCAIKYGPITPWVTFVCITEMCYSSLFNVRVEKESKRKGTVLNDILTIILHTRYFQLL